MKELAAMLTAEQGKTLPDAEGDVFRGLEVVEHAASIGNLQLGELANNVANGVDTYTEPAAGRVRRHHAVQLPGHDSAVDVPHGHRHGQHLRAQALRAGPHGHHAPVRAGAGSRRAPWRAERDPRRRRRGQRHLRPPDIKAISFVGSTKVGTHVYNRASLNGKRVQCMMGAKNHAIVMPDANKEQSLNALPAPPSVRPASAAWRCRWWCWWAKRRSGFPIWWPRPRPSRSGRHRAGTDVGPVVSCAALSRVEGLIERGIADGATLELDGRKPRSGL
jgi:malonate-semialdehyde dehydrogenase (acetylating)/methylmalonate-semialdehyde dehydrogenase